MHHLEIWARMNISLYLLLKIYGLKVVNCFLTFRTFILDCEQVLEALNERLIHFQTTNRTIFMFFYYYTLFIFHIFSGRAKKALYRHQVFCPMIRFPRPQPQLEFRGNNSYFLKLLILHTFH